MEYYVLDSRQFCQAYSRAFEKIKLESDEAREVFRNDLFALQRYINDELAKRWVVDNDFGMGWDYDYCYHVCAGIYSARIFRREYIECVGNVLTAFDTAGKWTFHTVCEIKEGDSALGEFFIRDGCCYINGAMEQEFQNQLVLGHSQGQ